MKSATLATLALTLLLAACNADSPRATDGAGEALGPTVVLLDSVRLAEDDSLYLGRPEQGFTLDEQGRYYIADEFLNRLVRYAPDGRIDRSFGRAGSGPGEMQSTQRVTLLIDSVVLQATAARLLGFDSRSGRFLYQITHPRTFLTPPIYDAGRVILPMFDLASKRAILFTTEEALLAHAVDSPGVALVPNAVDFPPEYLSHPVLTAFSSASAVLHREGLLVGFSGVPYLVRFDSAGNPLDTLHVPARIRRGHPPGWLDIFAEGKDPSLEQLVDAFSFLKQLWMMEDGRVVLWHQENRVMGTKGRPRVEGTAYISVLSADLRQVCLDTKLPFPGTAWPRLSMHHDTLMALDQDIDPTRGDSVTTVIRKYRIDTGACKWVTLR